MKARCNKEKEGFTVGKEYEVVEVYRNMYFIIGDNKTIYPVVIGDFNKHNVKSCDTERFEVVV